MGNHTSHMLGCAPVHIKNSKKFYNVEDFSTALRRNNSFTFFSSRQGSDRQTTEALIRLHEFFLEGSPDDEGQLSHDGFVSIFGLKADVYTHRLVRIFDLDNGGTIGFREFVYGLSKFQVDSFDRRVQFAYRLFDLDGDGSLDKHELMAAAKATLETDTKQYSTLPPHYRIKMPMRARPRPYDPQVKGNPAELREELDRMTRNMGSKRMGFSEFQLLVARFPQIFQPAEMLYRLMHVNSEDAGKVVRSMTEGDLKKLMQSLGRWQIDAEGNVATGFDDRSSSGPKYRLGASIAGEEVGPRQTNGGGGYQGGHNAFRRPNAPSKSLTLAPVLEPSPPPASSSTPDHWPCRACTLLNPRNKSECSACGTRRGSTENGGIPLDGRDSPGSAGGGVSRSASGGLSREHSLGRNVSSARDGVHGAQGSQQARFSPKTSDALQRLRDRSGSKLRRSNSDGSGAMTRVGSANGSGRGSPAQTPDGDLVDFLLDLGLSTHVRSFTRAEILTMEDLKLMTDADMAEVGLPKGPRLRIIDALKRIHGGDVRSDGRGGTGVTTCKICLDMPVQSVLKPCGHSLMCWRCANEVKDCPVCRKRIDEVIRWFPSF